MKKFIMTLLVALVLVPSIVCAKDDEKEKINVYIFHGNGCPHCQKAMEFFDSIEEEYGKYYNLVKYETWYSSRNNKLMKQVAEKMETDTSKLGVPYIIIGDKTFLGYAESYDEDIKKAIVDAYNSEDYVDKVKPVIDEFNKDITNTFLIAGAFCLLLVALVGINYGVRKVYEK